jgi:hypothetical protein
MWHFEHWGRLVLGIVLTAALGMGAGSLHAQDEPFAGGDPRTLDSLTAIGLVVVGADANAERAGLSAEWITGLAQEALGDGGVAVLGNEEWPQQPGAAALVLSVSIKPVAPGDSTYIYAVQAAVWQQVRRFRRPLWFTRVPTWTSHLRSGVARRPLPVPIRLAVLDAVGEFIAAYRGHNP